jgi:oxygen-independent coproporphyrinogen-3 oxidase
MTRSLKPFVFSLELPTDPEVKSNNDLGLYLHMPFCRSLCSFCPYCKVLYDKALALEYGRAMRKEIAMEGEKTKGKRNITSIYLGGGTPALMLDQLDLILETISMHFNVDGKIGIELHPKDITIQNIDKIKSLGINMASVGVQSFDKASLANLGRTIDDTEKRLDIIKKADFKVLDMDLIFAIPGQSEKSLIKDVETCFKLGATQVSTYPFIDFSYADNKYKPPGQRTKKRLLEAISKYCSENNLDRKSVWTFAIKNSEKYSSITRNQFIGFGVSAASLNRSCFKINTFSIPDYIDKLENNLEPTSLKIDMNLRQKASYYLFWAAYSLTVDKEDFEKNIGVPIERLYKNEIKILKALGIIEEEADVYSLTEKGAYIFHRIEQHYTRAYIDKMWKLSISEAFPSRLVLK